MKFVGNWGRLGMKFNIWEDCPKVPITELLSFIVDNRGKTVPTANDGWKLIATNCVTNNTLFPVYEKVRYLTQETYETWFRAHPMPGDILFVNKGTPGRVCMVPDPVDFCIAQDMIALRADDKKIYNKYLFAVLRSREIQQQIYNTNVGDVIPHFKKQFMDQLLIPVPDRKIQEKIGNLYYQLSYKVELNKKINENLYVQAQAIKKQWVATNEDGYQLLPLADVATINPDTYSPKEAWRYVNYLDTSSITNGVIANIQRIVPSNEKLPSRARRKVVAGDVLFSTVRPNQNHFGIISDPLPNMLASTGFAVIRSKNFLVCNELIYLCITERNFVEKMQQLAEQSTSTFPSIKPSDLETCQIPCPKDENSAAFTNTLKYLFDLIAINIHENNSLAAMRDTLIPKLMSGEIDISAINL